MGLEDRLAERDYEQERTTVRSRAAEQPFLNTGRCVCRIRFDTLLSERIHNLAWLYESWETAISSPGVWRRNRVHHTKRRLVFARDQAEHDVSGVQGRGSRVVLASFGPSISGCRHCSADDAGSEVILPYGRNGTHRSVVRVMPDASQMSGPISWSKMLS